MLLSSQALGGRRSGLNIQTWGYALLCVVLPILWGLAMVWVSNRLERHYLTRRPSPRDPASPPPSTLEYHI
jgi:hypothetical protein